MKKKLQYLFSALLTLLFIIFLFACNSDNTNQKQTESPVDSLSANVEIVKQFPDLIPGDTELDEDCFGEIIELAGVQKTTDAIFEVRETQMLVKDSLLIMANLNSENMFMAFSLPGFEFVKSFGKMGRGPCEFQYPQLVPAKNDTCFCYIYEKANSHIFSLQKDFTISELPFKLTDSQTKRHINDKQVVSFSPKEFVYAESVIGGKAVFDFCIQNDSVQNKMIYNLSFSEKHKSWASYIGDFGANVDKQRVVYAYKYFKQLVFVDLKNNTSRTVKFKSGEAKKGNAVSIMSPENITHYWECRHKTTLCMCFTVAVPRLMLPENGEKRCTIFLWKNMIGTEIPLQNISWITGAIFTLMS